MKLLLFFLIHALNGSVFSAKIYPVDETGDSGRSDRYQQQQPLTGQLGDLNDQSCPYITNYSTIIKTNESIADKAVFIEFRKGKKKEDCIQSCCSHTDCTLAVYENKDERNCYLFNCGKGEKSRCHFARHEGYMIMTFQHKEHVKDKSPLTKLKEAQHEDELEGLVVQKDEKPPEKTVKPATVPPVVTTTTTPKPANQDSDAGHLYGECSEGSYCKDENAVCRQGICVCKSGYHATYGMCNEQSAQGKPHGGRTKVNQPQIPEIKEMPSVEHVKPQEKIPPKPVPTTLHPTHAPTPAPTPAPTQPRVTETPVITTVITATTKHAAPKSSNSTGSHRAEEMVAGHDVAVEQIIIASPTDSAQGPIVALALGLAFTIMLLVFVGCRLRNVKRRIRKGRALHSNEADYLINGMYL